MNFFLIILKETNMTIILLKGFKMMNLDFKNLKLTIHFMIILKISTIIISKNNKKK